MYLSETECFRFQTDIAQIETNQIPESPDPKRPAWSHYGVG